jgi:hypothetical protein
MHLRGKAARYEALTADGREMLLDVPHYDFNWQLFYRLAKPQTFRQGETIRFTGWFDNSENNPANPDPSKTVRWGEQTEDEMHLGYVEYVVPGAKPGDPIAHMRQSRPGGGQSKPADADALKIGGQTIKPATLVKTLRQLDRNTDGKLDLAEVPTKHQRLFDLLDANGDDVLTIAEVHEAIRQQKDQ